MLRPRSSKYPLYMTTIYFSKNHKETQRAAVFLLEKMAKLKHDRAIVVALEGELGAGKTTFVQGAAKALGIKSRIKSPTFTLMREYKIPANSRWPTMANSRLIHLDCYRVRDHRDLKTLDLDSLFKLPDKIVLVEWPERISKILPKKLIKVHIDHISENKRKIQMTTSF